MKLNIPVTVITLLLLYACGSSKVLDGNSQFQQNYCAPAPLFQKTVATTPPGNTDSLMRVHPDMPVDVIMSANATGTLSLITEIKRLEKDTSLRSLIQRASIRSTIQQRLLLAVTEISGLAAEMDCEGERADQLGRYLDNLNSNRNTKLTVGSIIVAAITTVATIAFKDDRTQNVAAITGGVISSGMALMTVKPAGRKIRLSLHRNVLRDIWAQADTSDIYSPGLWYMLSDQHFSTSGTVSLVQSISGRWKKYDLDEKVSKGDEEKYFGNGGVYTADDLHTRAAMLNELQSTIRSLNQNLQSLMQYINSQVYLLPKN
ncbi:hypothetical protein SAMN05444266_103376 [Chitinophaga jiangningensis]|uniref:Uncharacterized protein n=1 Tax=Chitinophaga jiangningensis TaxID=1419482 RepID=A0A1M7AR40_9BACT|nr:hypothetical protein [Chitinophaga jiangningensis]SHL45086.1 hypothetical protein SAMN05444266_103376 [Chitinophaga jiangningensis]